MHDPIELKGIREGILVTIDPSPDWGSVVSELTTRIDDQSSFFRGATIVLQLQDRVLQRPDLARLVSLFEAREVELVSVLSTSATTQGATRQLGLSIDLDNITRSPSREQPPPYPEKLFEGTVDGTAGILINRTLRSGHSVKNPGHVVILGDVNPGAEVIAGGDVIVWGHLRGIVHAGAMGDDSCVVCALDLQPTQLRISSLISISPPGKRRKPRPERAYIQDGQIKAESWKN